MEREELWAVDGTVANTIINGSLGVRKKRSQRSRRKKEMLLSGKPREEGDPQSTSQHSSVSQREHQR